MSQDARIKIAQNVKSHRKRLGLTKENLSLELGFDNSYISKLERGNINITIDKLEKIATYFKINISDLFADIK